MPNTLITGASGALGGALVEFLLNAGHQVVAVTRESAKPTDSRRERLHPVAFDIAELDQWRTQLAEVERAVGPIDGAVLCAGGWAGGKPHHEADEATWQRMFLSNLETAQVSLRCLIAAMRERGRGSIVAIGSRAVERPWESAGAGAYGASKAALISLVQSCAHENRRDGIRINAVLPSVIDTPNNRAAMPNAAHEHWVTTTELAHAIRFLLSDDASGITGAALPVYGRV